MKLDIDSSMKIYDMMEEFQYQFPEEDIKKKWNAFKGPKDICELIDAQKALMDKEKSKFENRMAQEQEEFKTEIEEIDRTIMNFYQYTEIKQHHAVADMCLTSLSKRFS
jgi:dynein heavy chain